MVGAVLAGTPAASALDQQYADLSASVEVAGAFSVSLDKAQVVFENMDPGQTKVLGEGHYAHELTCRSNNGRPWYLKAQLVSLKHVARNASIPAASLKWKIVDSTGSGPVGQPHDFQSFADQSTLLYASQGDDNKGRAVVLHLQYSLTPPVTAPGGNYIGQLVFTMVEAP